MNSSKKTEEYMYSRLVTCFFSLIFFINSQSQSLKDLEQLVTTHRFDSAELYLDKKEYNFWGADKKVNADKVIDVVMYKREKADPYLSAFISISKLKIEDGRNLLSLITYMTFSEKKYKELRKECLSLRGVQFIKEDISKNTLKRNYRANRFEYVFISEGQKTDQDKAVFYVKIINSF